MSTHTIIEWAPFMLKKGITEDKLLTASEALQVEFLSRQQGFLRRELLKGENDQWVDMVIWESREAAERAVESAAGSPVCFEYFQLMDGADHADPGAGVLHLEQFKIY